MSRSRKWWIVMVATVLVAALLGLAAALGVIPAAAAVSATTAPVPGLSGITQVAGVGGPRPA